MGHPNVNIVNLVRRLTFMKFVITRRRKDAFLMLPAEKQTELGEGALAFIEKQRKAGKCKEIYVDVDLQGGGSIWELESDTEVAKLMLENPIAPFMDLDVRLVIDWDIAVKAMSEASRQ